MREALTFLAGLLVAALLAALLGPGFVDWREYRPHFEQRISAALGVETRVAGEIGLRLLPSPTWPTIGAIRPEASMSRLVSSTHSASREIGTQTSVATESTPGRSALAAQ